VRTEQRDVAGIIEVFLQHFVLKAQTISVKLMFSFSFGRETLKYRVLTQPAMWSH
jgi:hypothetical protein